jgi:hypothetical protein
MADTNFVVFGEKIDELPRTLSLFVIQQFKCCSPWISLERLRYRFEITLREVQSSKLTGPCWPHESA